MRILISNIRQGKVKPKRKFRLQSTQQGLYCMLEEFPYPVFPPPPSRRFGRNTALA